MRPPTHDLSLTERLAERLARPVTDHDRTRAAWHLLDWLGCALAARTSPAGHALALAVAPLPDGPCWLAGFGTRGAQAADAAFLHGGLGSVYELDDLHRAAIVHPSDTVVPAALAVAQREGAAAAALLEAIVRGHEAAIVIGRLAGPRHYRHWYSTATCGVFGAAAAAASLRGLSTQATTDALGLAGMLASGPWQCREEDSHAKQVATAHAARSGVHAADMAVAGLTGPRHILEGRHGWLMATGAALATEADQAFAQAVRSESGRAEPWQIHAVSFKPWPACRHVHPAIEAALKLRERLGIDRADASDRIAQLESIEVETYQDALAFANRPHPTTDHEARFSLQHAVAVTLLRGDFTLADAGPSVRKDPRVAALRAQVKVRSSVRFEAAYPARFGSAVTLRPSTASRDERSGSPGASASSTADNAITVTVEAALGDPEHPMSEDALRKKALTLFEAAGMDDAQRELLLAACLGLASRPGNSGRPPHRLEHFWNALAWASAGPHKARG